MFKQAIIVRKDLKMSKGKIAAQVAHASLSCSIKVMNSKKKWFEIWNMEGQKKVILKVKNLEELKKLKKKAVSMKLPHEIIKDRGLTEVKPGTITCMAIGPAPEEILNKITGELKLL